MLFYADYGYELSIKLDDKEFGSFVSGGLAEGHDLRLDRDGNGKRIYKLETVQVGEPFNFTGTTYVLGVKDGAPTRSGKSGDSDAADAGACRD